MSFFGMNLVGNAIDAFQEAMNVTSDNISNVATPGASRQEPLFNEVTPISASPFAPSHIGDPGTQGQGAMVEQIKRIHDNSFDGLFRGASSSASFFSVQQQQLTAVQAGFGEPSSGVSSAFSAFQSAISNLGSTPTSPTGATVLTAANNLALKLQSSAAAISQQELVVQQQATTTVAKANTLIDQIASLNGEIRAATAVGDNPNTFEDQRDSAIDQLSGLISTTTSLQSNGSTLVTVNGQALVNDTTAYHLAPPVIGSNPDGTPSFKIGFASDPNPSNPTAIPLGSGQLAGYADVFNNKLISYGQQLDAFASSLANETNRISEAGADLNGNAGGALFGPISSQQPISASNITVLITDPHGVSAGLVSTAAGNLTQAINSANNSVSGSANIDGNVTLNNPPAGPLVGTLTVTVNGVAQTLNYDTTPPNGNAVSLNTFVSSFNAAQLGVTASFDPKSQTIVFARDPGNAGAALRAAQGSNPTTPSFTISDSLPAAGAGPGTPATSLLEALGAAGINGVPQTVANALGTGGNGDANALTSLFSSNVGIGALQTTVTAVTPGPGASVTITPQAAGDFANIVVGQALTIGAGATAQNVIVTAINRNTGTISVNASLPIAAGAAITTTPTQTLGTAYGTLVSGMALDLKTASTSATTQTNLANNIDSSRQSVDGINIDEETQNLLKYQDAYTAAAKTLAALNTMIQTILGLGGGTSAAP